MVGVSMDAYEVVFHVHSGLGLEFWEIAAAIRTLDMLITFEELHDKLANYDDFLKRNPSMSPDTFVPTTAHFVSHPSMGSKYAFMPSRWPRPQLWP